MVAACPGARAWLRIQADLGLARNTVEAYGRALQDYLTFTARAAVASETAGRAHIAAYVRDLTARPSPGGTTGREPDSRGQVRSRPFPSSVARPSSGRFRSNGRYR